MPVVSFDHVAIPTNDPEGMIAFYTSLGFDLIGVEDFRSGGRPFFSIVFGDNKINVHAPALWQDERFTLRGPTAVPGCGDFCFVWDGDLRSLETVLRTADAKVETGPVEREGGRGGGRDRGTSIYTRDPDRNLLEFIVYDEA